MSLSTSKSLKVDFYHVNNKNFEMGQPITSEKRSKKTERMRHLRANLGFSDSSPLAGSGSIPMDRFQTNGAASSGFTTNTVIFH